MRKKVIVMVAAVLAPGVAVGAGLYKCVDAQGKVSYQNVACAAAQETQELKLYDKRPTGGGAGLRQGEIELYNDYVERDAFNAAADEGLVMVGMSRHHVERAWGEPTEVNSLVDYRGRAEQLVYRTYRRHQSVVLVDGKVTSILDLDR